MLVPLVIAAWWAGAPGVGRATVATVAGIGVAYVVFRLSLHDPALPLFEQDIGLGFGNLSASEAEARFGSFPLWIYAYSAASTISNVLFAEPTSGVFRILRALSEGRPLPWHFVHLFSSLWLTALIVWWGGWHPAAGSQPQVVTGNSHLHCDGRRSGSVRVAQLQLLT